MKTGRLNAGAGLITMAVFMAYGFLLIYLRDFHPDKEAWIAAYGIGKHFEARLAHVHGNLFGMLNLIIAFVLVKLTVAPERCRKVVAWTGVIGILMPFGILAEIYLGLPPILVLIGALSMTVSVGLAGVMSFKFWGKEV